MSVCVKPCLYYHANRKQSETHHWLPNSGSVQSTVSKPFLFYPSTPHFSFKISPFLSSWFTLSPSYTFSGTTTKKQNKYYCFTLYWYCKLSIYVCCTYKVNHFGKRTKLMRQLLIWAIWSCVHSIDCNADGIRYCWRAPMTYIARTRQRLNRITAQWSHSSPGHRLCSQEVTLKRHYMCVFAWAVCVCAWAGNSTSTHTVFFYLYSPLPLYYPAAESSWRPAMYYHYQLCNTQSILISPCN